MYWLGSKYRYKSKIFEKKSENVYAISIEITDIIEEIWNL